MKTLLLLIGLTAGCFFNASAAISEPDNVVYGTITLGGNQVTASGTNVFVEARLQLGGPPIASYQMGSRPSVGNFYSLRISLQSIPPVTAPDATQVSEGIYIVVRDDSGVRAQTTYTVGAPGLITRLDFSGANTGQTSHPADISPTDNSISISEVVAYTLAWRSGAPWSVAPTNIPVSYAVRAGALWRGGEAYRLDGTVSNAPAWWINTNAVATFPNPNSDLAVSALPAAYTPGVPFTVTDTITPSASVTVYAVEDQPPPGWIVSNISGGGVFDAVNQKVKWGLFFDQTPRTFTYQVTPPASAGGTALFDGQASFDGLVTLNISGQRATFFNASPIAAFGIQPLGFGSGFHLTVKGAQGQNLIVETSTDLQNWQTLSTLMIDATGTNSLIDPVGTNHQRFYRVRPGP